MLDHADLLYEVFGTEGYKLRLLYNLLPCIPFYFSIVLFYQIAIEITSFFIVTTHLLRHGFNLPAIKIMSDDNKILYSSHLVLN